MHINILNETTDPFESENDNENKKVHIRVKQRKGRQYITTIEGLADDLNLKHITKALKKAFNCNGTIRDDSDYGTIMQLSGDQRINVRDFLIDQEVCSKDQLVIHGG
jgi:translation initiation factor 1